MLFFDPYCKISSPWVESFVDGFEELDDLFDVGLSRWFGLLERLGVEFLDMVDYKKDRKTVEPLINGIF